MAAAGIGSRILGMTFAIPGAWVCLIALIMVYGGAWKIWPYGSRSGRIMIGMWDITDAQYFLLCGAVFVVGVVLLGVGIQFFFSTPRDE